MPFGRSKNGKIEIIIRAQGSSGKKEKYESKLSKKLDDDNLAREYSEILSTVKGKGFI